MLDVMLEHVVMPERPPGGHFRNGDKGIVYIHYQLEEFARRDREDRAEFSRECARDRAKKALQGANGESN